jgi:multisubunit Na+/H+ antiporter MnhE subunit
MKELIEYFTNTTIENLIVGVIVAAVVVRIVWDIITKPKCC